MAFVSVENLLRAAGDMPLWSAVRPLFVFLTLYLSSLHSLFFLPLPPVVYDKHKGTYHENGG